jgi:hypothetical protein
MVRNGDLVAIFHSIHKVMKAEQILKRAGCDILLIPVPRELSSDCGLAIRYSPGSRAEVEECLAREGVPPVELYKREGEEYRSLTLPRQ